MPCPFCGGEVMLRAALWPSEGDRDDIIHAAPTNCPLATFADDTFDGSIVDRWNTRSSGLPSGSYLEWAERLIAAIDEARCNSDSKNAAAIAAARVLFDMIATIGREAKSL